MDKNVAEAYGYATIVHSIDDKDLFPVGFKYSISGEVFEVAEIGNDGPNAFRLMRNSKGNMVSIDVSSIIRDSQSPDFIVLNDPSTSAKEKAEEDTKEITEPEN